MSKQKPKKWSKDRIKEEMNNSKWAGIIIAIVGAFISIQGFSFLLIANRNEGPPEGWIIAWGLFLIGLLLLYLSYRAGVEYDKWKEKL